MYVPPLGVWGARREDVRTVSVTPPSLLEVKGWFPCPLPGQDLLPDQNVGEQEGPAPSVQHLRNATALLCPSPARSPLSWCQSWKGLLRIFSPIFLLQAGSQVTVCPACVLSHTWLSEKRQSVWPSLHWELHTASLLLAGAVHVTVLAAGDSKVNKT